MAPNRDFLHRRQTEAVGGRKVRDEISIERIFAHLHVVEVLATDILRGQRGGEATIVDCKAVVGHDRRREGNRGVLASRLGYTFAPVGIGQVGHVILDLVLAQSHIGVPTEHRTGLPCTGQFDTGAVAVGDILGNGFADFVEVAVEHELIFVLHPIEAGRDLELLAVVAIAGFVVDKSFGTRRMRREGLFVVVARRFTMRHAHRSIGLLIGGNHPRGTELGVEEVELHIRVVVGVSCPKCL